MDRGLGWEKIRSPHGFRRRPIHRSCLPGKLPSRCVSDLSSRRPRRFNAEVHDELDQNKLREWVQEPAHPFTPTQRVVAAVLGVFAVCTLSYWISGGSVSPFLAVLVAEIIFYLRLVKEIRHIEIAAEKAGSGLTILGQVLEHLERRQFQCEYLASRRAVFDVGGQPPSVCINHLRNLIQNLSACLQNRFADCFSLELPVYIAHRVELSRNILGPTFPNGSLRSEKLRRLRLCRDMPSNVRKTSFLSCYPVLTVRISSALKLATRCCPMPSAFAMTFA